MTVDLTSDLLRNFFLAVISVAGAIKVSIDAYTKRAQRKREEKRAQRELEVAAALAERDLKKAEFDKAVAQKVEEAAQAAKAVKQDLAQSTTQTSKAICEVKDELGETHSQVDRVHKIVNSEKTRMMEDMKASRLLNLTMAEALLADHPNSESAKQAVVLAQTLYNQISKDTANKEEEDRTI
jgi:hypothetical protein